MLVVRRHLSVRCSRDVIKAAILQLWLQQLFSQSKTQGGCGLPSRKQAVLSDICGTIIVNLAFYEMTD